MWEEDNTQLHKTFTFVDFKTALAFVNKIGELAEKVNHHPDIELSWGKVGVHLTTHSQGGVTEKDHQMAKEIDALWGNPKNFLKLAKEPGLLGFGGAICHVAGGAG